ncbi:MAG: hypothetical protein KAJ14_06165 [Candidatus Omnitrophica bacterium]|nr:hypothetical protein [Candidatus Omnitrophota bacterium]MCK5492675.1 hypothetical protein [Candidatus Omnitrophota bacterium]
MKGKIFISGLVSLFLIGGVFAIEEHKVTESKSSLKEETSGNKTESPAVEVGNTKCPVSGMEIGTIVDPVKYVYKGKIYNLCGERCIKSFQENPEKFIKIIEE